MRSLILLVALTFALAACSGGGTDETAPATQGDPVEVADDWLAAVSSLDTAALADLVQPDGLAVLAAVESNLRSDELVALLESGMSEGLRAQYWSQFRDDFARFSGTDLAALEPGDVTTLTTGYAAVALVGPDSAGYVILRQDEGRWQVDFPATIGPSLVGPLGEYLASAAAGDSGARIAAAFGDYVAPGLDAALALDDSNTRLEFEAEYIRQLAGSVATTP